MISDGSQADLDVKQEKILIPENEPGSSIMPGKVKAL